MTNTNRFFDIVERRKVMRKTILVVEDFKTIRAYVCETLNKKGYATLEASNGNEAYSILVENSQSIHLVLTDYHMTDCTGLELLQKIKSNPMLTQTHLIFLTAETSQEKIVQAKGAGAIAWIQKPYRSESFFAQIENAISCDK